MENSNGATQTLTNSKQITKTKLQPATHEEQESQHYNNGDSVKEKITFSLLKFETIRAENTTPKGSYKLSNLDQTVPYPIEVIVAFERKNYDVDVGEILKVSLSKVLEEYYPLAGRLKMGCDGKVVAECGGGEGGVPFVEAFCDVEMVVAVGDIAVIDQKLVSKLVYSNHKPYETILDIPPLAIQVTTFRCGGVILGVRFNHVFIDGIGFVDLMKSWSEIARGLQLSTPPYMDRSILSPRNPPKISFPHPEYSKVKRPLTPQLTNNQENKIIVTKSFIFTPTKLSHLKKLATNNKSLPVISPPPTTFELISALSWICWTKAKKVNPHDNTQIVTAVDGRHKLQPPLPAGYFGNGVVWSCARSTAIEITRQPISYAVEIVRDALKTVTEEYVRSAIDFHEVTKKPLESENTLWITKWSRLPFYGIDFGWGEASQVAPGAILENLVVLFSQENDSENLVIALTLPAEAMEIFQELIENYN